MSRFVSYAGCPKMDVQSRIKPRQPLDFTKDNGIEGYVILSWTWSTTVSAFLFLRSWIDFLLITTFSSHRFTLTTSGNPSRTRSRLKARQALLIWVSLAHVPKLRQSVGVCTRIPRNRPPWVRTVHRAPRDQGYSFPPYLHPPTSRRRSSFYLLAASYFCFTLIYSHSLLYLLGYVRLFI